MTCFWVLLGLDYREYTGWPCMTLNEFPSLFCYGSKASHGKRFDLYCVRVSKSLCLKLIVVTLFYSGFSIRKRIFRFWKIIQMSFYFINKYLVFFISMLLIILIFIDFAIMLGDIYIYLYVNSKFRCEWDKTHVHPLWSLVYSKICAIWIIFQFRFLLTEQTCSSTPQWWLGWCLSYGKTPARPQNRLTTVIANDQLIVIRLKSIEFNTWIYMFFFWR